MSSPSNQNFRTQMPNNQNLFYLNNNSPFSNQNRPNNYFQNNNNASNPFAKSNYPGINQQNNNYYGQPQNMNPGIPPYVNPNLPHPNTIYNNLNKSNYNNNVPFNNRPNLNNNYFPYNNQQNLQKNQNNQNNNEKEYYFQQLLNEKNNVFNILEKNSSFKIINDSDIMSINRLHNEIFSYNNNYLIKIQNKTITDSLNFLKNVIVETSLEPDSIEYILGLELNKFINGEEENKIKKIISDCKYELLDHLEFKTNINNEEKSNLKEFIRNTINTLKKKRK
jgi:hypothetical protein